MNVYPYFPHLLCHLDEIRYSRSAHNAVERFWIMWKSAQAKSYFYCGRKWNNIYSCTVKPYIMTVKERLVEVCVLRHGAHHLQPCLNGLLCVCHFHLNCVHFLQDWWWPSVRRDKQWQPSATCLFRMRGRKICAQIASSPKTSTVQMDQEQWKAKVAIWQPCTPAVPILGGRISRHLRYACASHFNNILSHHCHYETS